jgi:outer membrane receptor protein involved in Fe transport
VDVTLEVGADTQSVTVDSGGDELITTTATEVSATVTPALVQEIPLARQSFMDLLVMTPGTVPQTFYYHLSLGSENLSSVTTGGGGSVGDFTVSGIFVGGNRDTGTNISVDGTNVQSRLQSNLTQLQSPASIQDVRVESGTMNAEFGFGVGAVNVITKSGTNEYHGTAYEFLRNNHLNAAPFFTNLLEQKLPTYQQNQFGGAVGGPIKKNKLLFFTNYEGMRVRESATAFDQVPSDGVFNGDFSGYPTIYNPFKYDPITGLRQPFPNNQIPLGPTDLCAPRPQCADPSTLAYLQKWVSKPNTTLNGLPTLVGTARTVLGSDQLTLRMDYIHSSKTTLYGRFTYLEATQSSEGIQPLQSTDNPYSSRNGVLHWTQVIKPTMVNDLMVGYARPWWFIGRDTKHGNIAKEIGLKNVSDNLGAPIFLVPEYNLDVSQRYLYDALQDTYQLKDDLSYVRGRHSMKFGMEITEDRQYINSVDIDLGNTGFENVFSRACPAGNEPCEAARAAAGLADGGSALADFLLGTVQSATLTIADRRDSYQTYYGLYAQDSWRATSKLTVNFGLRYEHYRPWLVPRNTNVQWDAVNGGPLYVLQNPLDYFDPTKCLGKCAPLVPGLPREGYRTSRRDFAPRLGLAYQLTQKTVVRAGAGVYFDGNSDNAYRSTASLPPFGQTAGLISTVDQQLPAYFVSELFPPPPPTGILQPNSTPPTALFVLYHSKPVPAIYQWSFSVQRSLNPYWSLDLNYLGSHTIHENMGMDLNSAQLPQGEWADKTLQERRLFPQWGRVRTVLPIGWSKYNAFIASLKNREWHGLTLMANFTWAKGTITNNPARSEFGVSSIFAPYILAGESAWVPRNSLQTGYNYTLPFGRGKAFGNSGGPVLDKLVGGWSVSGITWFSTGSPQPVYAATDLTGVALLNAFPNRICDPNSGPQTRLQWFNTSCFVDAPFGTWPNSPMGAVTFPGVNNWDLSISKKIQIKERHRLEFKADMFNAFNHTQWGDVRATYGSSTFGQVLDTRPPRKIQLALRYFF